VQAEAAVAVARTQLARLEAGPSSGEVAAAEARLEAARGAVAQAAAHRDQLTAGALEAEVAAAQAQLAAAQAEELSARIARDQIRDRKEAERWEKEDAILRLRAAEQRRVEAALRVVQAEERGAVQVRVAQAAVSKAAAQQDVARAQFDMLRAAATSEEIAFAQSSVTEAEAAVRVTRAALDQATLSAPFAGVVTAIGARPGETVLPGQAVLTLADLRHLQVETTDLSERDVARVKVAQPVTVYVEALAEEIAGQVVEIAPQASTVGGDIVYTVTIALKNQPPGLRWGMSVEVEIDVR
jgi:HlyD family secretion protein